MAIDTYASGAVVLLDAPSNLGLRPPAAGVAPGVYKLAGALRDQGLLERLGAREGGVVTPPRYEARRKLGSDVRNGAAIERYSCALADRVGGVLDAGAFPFVLGGDCSILLGGLLALRRKGRFGLVYVDAHGDFRHPGNGVVGAAAGEDLALATGRGGPLADLEGLGPLVDEADVVVLGIRAADGWLSEVRASGIEAVTSAQLRERGAARAAQDALARLAARGVDGIWLHVDADVLDEKLMPAVDSPSRDGLTFEELAELLGTLLRSELAAGLQLTIYDPDLDEDAALAARLADSVVSAFPVRTIGGVR